MFEGGILTGIAEAICEYSKRVFAWDVAKKAAEFVKSKNGNVKIDTH